jgi:hypothetical protein
MKEEEDAYRTLFVRERENTALDNPLLLLVDVFERQLRSAGEAGIPTVFEMHCRRPEKGAACIVDTINDFLDNWTDFHNQFGEGFPWQNVLCAGGAVLACLLPFPDGIDELNASDAVATFYREQSAFRDSDIDLFIYGLSAEEASVKVAEIYAFLERCSVRVVAVRSEHCITFVCSDASERALRHVQVILRCYKSPAEILMGFDVDCCCVGFDGCNVYALPRAIRALERRVNLVDPSRQSKS